MKKRMKRHYIRWGRLRWRCDNVSFGTELEETHRYGWQTPCGEFLWPKWEGTTNKNDVTCLRCRKILGLK